MMQGIVSRMNRQQNQYQPQEQPTLLPSPGDVVLMDESLSNSTSAVSVEALSASSNINPSAAEPCSFYFAFQQQQSSFPDQQTQSSLQPPPAKKKRNLPGNPDPDAEVIALSPKTLLATNRFVCEICNKGFQRDQNLQLHRRGHNLPWKLKQRSNKEVVKKKVYVCPEPSCVHHDPSRALGDLTGIKKHFCRKHGEKKWKCDKCSKRYAVQSDWKAHSKTCGTREYKCDCGTLFSRRDSFITHRAFCDALAEETARAITTTNPLLIPTHQASTGCSSSSVSHMINLQAPSTSQLTDTHKIHTHQPHIEIKREQNHNQQTQSFNLMPPWLFHRHHQTPSLVFSQELLQVHHQDQNRGLFQNPNPLVAPTTASFPLSVSYPSPPSQQPHMSATALLQKAAQMGATKSNQAGSFGPFQCQAHVSTAANNNNIGTAVVGFGLNLSSRDREEEINASGFFDHMGQDLSSFAGKAVTSASGGPTNGSGGNGGSVAASGGGSNNAGVAVTKSTGLSSTSNSPPAPLNNPSSFTLFNIDDMMLMNTSLSSYDGNHHANHQHGHDGSTAFFGGGGGETIDSTIDRIANKKDDQVNVNGYGREAGGDGGGRSEGLTRDFLGLRPLSQSDILNIVGLGSCMGNSGNAATPTTASTANDQHH